MVYAADVDGVSHQFGVSGLLYNSDVLLFDRETESLWSQILSRAISGKLVGKTLTILTSSHTRWGDWKKKFPNTQVLSTDTGYNRDYSRSPYGDYSKSKRTYFPVAFRSQRYHPKERVIGITIEGKQKAYPFTELAKLKTTSLKDTFLDQPLTIEFDAKNRDGVVKDADGKVISSVNTFWFAWYGFHPKAEIFKAK